LASSTGTALGIGMHLQLIQGKPKQPNVKQIMLTGTAHDGAQITLEAMVAKLEAIKYDH